MMVATMAWPRISVDHLRQSKNAGKFTLAPGKEIYGELTLSGPETLLYLYDRQEFDTHATPHQYVTGVLHDLTKVSLINCLTTLVPGHGGKSGEEYYFVDVFPHFVVSGDSFLAPDEKTITKLHFVVDDATTLFYDFDAFGILLDSRPFIDQITIANGNAVGRTIEIGPDPRILYFTGKREIFAADTLIGRVSASHNPMPITFGGPSGVGLKNTIFVTIEFPERLVFDQSIHHLTTVLRFLEILAGRPQNLVAINLTVQSAQQSPVTLAVYWSMQPKREPRPGAERPHPADVLLDPVRQPGEFSRVLASWLDRDDSWRDARARFSNCFAKQNSYDIDRLIGAANMFDILPSGAVPSDVQLSKELEDAKLASRDAFRQLPRTLERDSVLGALGRVGEANLKHKVRHRAGIILKAIGAGFLDLTLTTDEAVNCRNFYVHGGDASLDYNANFDRVTFFTQTLEFVFAASDLVEAGWDIKAWSTTGTTMSHPFGRYRINYAQELQALKALLA
jgi:hypothetical protein